MNSKIKYNGRELYVEEVIEGTKDKTYVIQSTFRPATQEDLDSSIHAHNLGYCDKGTFYDEPGFVYDIRHCGVCDIVIGMI